MSHINVFTVFFQQSGVLYQSQYGFHPKRCTTDAVTEFVQDAINAIEQKEYMINTSLDLSKTFDTIDHNILLIKIIEHYGILGVALDWFKSYLSNRRQFVSRSGILSDAENISYGVLQGLVLGPLLFMMHINDLNHPLKLVKAILFAVDTTIYAPGPFLVPLVTPSSLTTSCWVQSTLSSHHVAGEGRY